MFPMLDSVLQSVAGQPGEAVSVELSLAAPSLMHLHSLTLISRTIALDCMLQLSSLRRLSLSLRSLPSASTLELLLRRLPALRCTLMASHVDDAELLPPLKQLAQHCPRFVIKGM
jgi:hypothetical protein